MHDYRAMTLDRDRMLALSYVPPDPRRNRLQALWALDAALAAVLKGREPMISRIKLAWWREALEALDHRPPPAEPVLQGLAAQVLPAGVTGAELAAMEAGWGLLLEPQLEDEALDSYAASRGGALFQLSARLLQSGATIDVARAGEGWALVDLARRANDADAAVALAAAATRLDRRQRWPRRLRPLGMLAALAARDVARGIGAWEAQGAPARMLRMLRVALTGR